MALCVIALQYGFYISQKGMSYIIDVLDQGCYCLSNAEVHDRKSSWKDTDGLYTPEALI